MLNALLIKGKDASSVQLARCAWAVTHPPRVGFLVDYTSQKTGLWYCCLAWTLSIWEDMSELWIQLTASEPALCKPVTFGMISV